MLQNEYKWFLDNYADLYKQYGASFLAIKNKTVLGVYHSYAEGVKKLFRMKKQAPSLFKNATAMNRLTQIIFHQYALVEHDVLNTR